MFYLTFKYFNNCVNTFGFMEGEGGGELLKPLPQVQELQKSPGVIGLTPKCPRGSKGPPIDF